MQQIGDWQQKYQKLEQEYIRLRTFESKANEYEGRIALLTTEIERQNQRIAQL